MTIYPTRGRTDGQGQGFRDGGPLPAAHVDNERHETQASEGRRPSILTLAPTGDSVFVNAGRAGAMETPAAQPE
jgi:hypothetical protein